MVETDLINSKRRKGKKQQLGNSIAALPLCKHESDILLDVNGRGFEGGEK